MKSIIGQKAMIIGLDGDPVSKGTGDPTLSDLLYENDPSQPFSFNYYFGGNSLIDRHIFWSRVLVCRLIHPQARRQDSIALVLKPRSVWLFKHPTDSAKLVDISGDETDGSDPSDVGDTGTNDIQIVHPKYKIGQIIQVGSLNDSINFTTNGGQWTDSSQSFMYDYISDSNAFGSYDESLHGGVHVSLIGAWHPWHQNSDSGYSVFGSLRPITINYFDLNVDGRKRGGFGSVDGDRITIPVCKGGVIKNYRVVGEEVL